LPVPVDTRIRNGHGGIWSMRLGSGTITIERS
jgi:hypothetical protein